MKVLIVDDSQFWRRLIRDSIKSHSEIKEIREACNGLEGLNTFQFYKPDVIISDIEMPEMDGVAMIKEVRKFDQTVKVLIVSLYNMRSARMTLEALMYGATDFLSKASDQQENSTLHGNTFQERLFEKLMILKLIKGNTDQGTVEKSVQEQLEIDVKRLVATPPEIMVIASSTGGPDALTHLFSRLYETPPFPIVVVQHMPVGFTEQFARMLALRSIIDVSEVKFDEVLVPGKIYIAPGGYHLRLKKSGTEIRSELVFDEPINYVRPSADPLFQSAAELFGRHVVGLVLTGMGADGKDGALRVKELGGRIFIQDEQSSVVWGMPGAVHKAGAYDLVVPLSYISSVVNACAKIKSRPKRSSTWGVN